MASLVIAEHYGGALAEATARAVTAAGALRGDVHVLVAGLDCAASAAAAAALAGVTRVLRADGPALAHAMAEPHAALIAGLAEGYDTLVAAATSAGKNLMPRVAALLDVVQVSDVTRIVDSTTFVRPIHAGNALAIVRSTDSRRVLTVRPAAFAPAAAGSASAPIETVAAPPDPGLSRFVGRDTPARTRPELTAARVVVSGGRALGSAAQFEQVLGPLADRLGAALGATRAAVDAGYAPNDWQVGQTGVAVAPELYIAVGVSGAVQHICGMRESKCVVAINSDPEAPIFKAADLGLVGDLFALVPALIAALE